MALQQIPGKRSDVTQQTETPLGVIPEEREVVHTAPVEQPKLDPKASMGRVGAGSSLALLLVNILLPVVKKQKQTKQARANNAPSPQKQASPVTPPQELPAAP